MTYPYSDDLMFFDEARNRYILTEAALTANGTFLRQKLSYNKTIDPSTVITRVLTRVSEMIYTYIHSFSANNYVQDKLIAEIPSLRPIIYDALLCQAEYFLLKGDLTRDLDKNIRALAIDDNAKRYLETNVRELGYPITYAGG